MSISTPSPMTELLIKKMEELQGKPVAKDANTALYDSLAPMTSKQGGDMARAQGEPVSIELNEIGDIREVGGVKYKVTKDGWRKVE